MENQLIENGELVVIKLSQLSELIGLKVKDAMFGALDEYNARKLSEKKPDERISQKEVCEILHKSISTLNRWEKEGYLIPAGRNGKTPYYYRSQIDNLGKLEVA
ncbi:MAG: MerR family transcriptional regulator [Prevotella sp.]|nr:MerR family transcriptional regulator [Prevotella sp.]